MSYHTTDINFDNPATGQYMPHKVKLFQNGRSQAVRLPAAFRFDCEEVYIRRDPDTGNVVLSRKPSDWKEFLTLRERLHTKEELSDNFPDGDVAKNVEAPSRDPFEGWSE